MPVGSSRIIRGGSVWGAVLGLMAFGLALTLDFLHFIMGYIGEKLYVIRSSSVRTLLAAGPKVFLGYLCKRTTTTPWGKP